MTQNVDQDEFFGDKKGPSHSYDFLKLYSDSGEKTDSD